jgi:hypothetical protein
VSRIEPADQVAHERQARHQHTHAFSPPEDVTKDLVHPNRAPLAGALTYQDRDRADDALGAEGRHQLIVFEQQ